MGDEKTRSDKGFFENMTESELSDFEDILHDMMEEYLVVNMLEYSKPDFNDNFVKKITECFYVEWVDAEICEEDDYDEIYEFTQR